MQVLLWSIEISGLIWCDWIFYLEDLVKRAGLFPQVYLISFIKNKIALELHTEFLGSDSKWHGGGSCDVLQRIYSRIYMEFRKMVTITLYTRQQKRHWCIEQSYGLCGRWRGWEDLGEWHWNIWNVMYEMRCQPRFNARCWMLGAGALGRPRGMVWGGRREDGPGWGTHVYLWWIHFDIWQK